MVSTEIRKKLGAYVFSFSLEIGIKSIGAQEGEGPCVLLGPVLSSCRLLF